MAAGPAATETELIACARTRYEGRTVLITGASDGIGVQIARLVASAGGQVVMPVRNREKGERVRAGILEEIPDARITLRDLDLASLTSTHALAEALVADGAPIHGLVLNAGVVLFGDRTRHVTGDGFEMHLQTNFLGHFALVADLLPLLIASGTRIVAQVSLAAVQGRIRFDDLQSERRYSALRAYRTSKIALGLFGVELQRRGARDAHDGRGVTVNLCHPGIAPATAIAPPIRAMLPRGVVDAATRHLGNPPEQAALTAVAALTAERPVAAAPSGETTAAEAGVVSADGATADGAPADRASPVAAMPDLYAPSRWFGAAGPPRRRAPFRTMTDPDAAAQLWNAAAALIAPR
ncbi:SDR family NAD(P)-dependent oxidoreductase [Humibacter ginsenosidimutans]|uniref:SDR family NAD(P)-dependent oxidoreductase n=1 Tax=Humibacter ginsenosidimutans TaxID=2599293 RepID=UPI00143D8FFE|nr:SDR family NAD(P)-dependent oxidoreductase [Humibacter ginsenosidimutans]